MNSSGRKKRKTKIEKEGEIKFGERREVWCINLKIIPEF
jgi:hypothetical protein